MHISVRGWGRDLGETTLVREPLHSAEEPGDRLSRDKLYKKVFDAEDRRRTKVRISTSAEMRLGGTYLLRLELSRKEIAQLFFETHTGSMVRMIKSFIEDENKEDHAQEIERHRRVLEKLKEETAEGA
jgi:hypothetical protein